MRFLALLPACLLAALVLLGGAADASPTCAEGPATSDGTIYGTPCADVIVAPPGVETVEAGGGDDTIVAGPITAASDCPAGCHLGVGSQTFEGGEGDDVVYGERGNDILRGGPGNDQLFGGIGDDLLQGGSGDDRLAGGFGFDSIDGGGDDDYVRGDATIDRLFDSGGGTDTLSFSTGVTPGFGDSLDLPGFPASGGERGVELELGVVGQNADNGIAALGGGVDEVETGAFETIVGTPFSDHIVGTGAAETIYGGGGADALEGGGGGDALFGGADGDLCQGGTGSECEAGVASRDTSKVSVGFMTPPGATPYTQLYVVGSSGNDNLTATYSPVSVSFELASGSFDQSPGDAGGCEVKTATEAVCALSAPLDSLLLAGMGGADTILATTFPASVGVVATGGEGGDTMEGGGESEEILIDGPGSGADDLRGLGGDEALTHNGGADELLGGDGNDLFLSVSICDGERVVGGPGRDSSSWARFKDGGAYANLESGVAGRPSGAQALDCGAEPTDSLQEIEDLEGSENGDVLFGSAGPNQLLGRAGPDAYFAAAGEDSILANSGDADVVIDCGADEDSAVIDRPQYGDPQPVECESVYEADPNNFRTRTLLPPPPLPEPPPPAPRRDLRPPQTRLTAHPPARLRTRTKWRRIAFRFTSSEARSSFRCKLDSRPFRPCASPRAYRVKAGAHAFRVFAIDRAGNRDATPAVFRFRLLRR
jgi:Ca2+-binding RTX toxin-like protein